MGGAGYLPEAGDDVTYLLGFIGATEHAQRRYAHLKIAMACARDVAPVKKKRAKSVSFLPDNSQGASASAVVIPAARRASALPRPSITAPPYGGLPSEPERAPSQRNSRTRPPPQAMPDETSLPWEGFDPDALLPNHLGTGDVRVRSTMTSSNVLGVRAFSPPSSRNRSPPPAPKPSDAAIPALSPPSFFGGSGERAGGGSVSFSAASAGLSPQPRAAPAPGTPSPMTIYSSESFSVAYGV